MEDCELNYMRIYRIIKGASKTFGMIDLIDSSDFDAANDNYRNVRGYMYQFFEDIRLIYALRIYPIEEKMAFKSKLSDLDFIEVINCLDQADENIVSKHYKDCVDRCRESLEKTVTTILTKTEKKPSGYFATDMGNLSNMHLIDKEPKRLIEATYSYLSEIGVHGRGGKLDLGDANYAIKETYMRIDILVKCYEEFIKK